MPLAPRRYSWPNLLQLCLQGRNGVERGPAASALHTRLYAPQTAWLRSLRAGIHAVRPICPALAPVRQPLRQALGCGPASPTQLLGDCPMPGFQPSTLVAQALGFSPNPGP